MVRLSDPLHTSYGSGFGRQTTPESPGIRVGRQLTPTRASPRSDRSVTSSQSGRHFSHLTTDIPDRGRTSFDDLLGKLWNAIDDLANQHREEVASLQTRRLPTAQERKRRGVRQYSPQKISGAFELEAAMVGAPRPLSAIEEMAIKDQMSREEVPQELEPSKRPLFLASRPKSYSDTEDLSEYDFENGGHTQDLLEPDDSCMDPSGTGVLAEGPEADLAIGPTATDGRARTSILDQSRKFLLRQSWISAEIEGNVLHRHTSTDPQIGPHGLLSRSAECGRKRKSIIEKMVIRPHSPVRTIWLLVSAAFLLYDLVVAPVELSFEFEKPPLMRVATFSGNIFWTLDIVFTFFTGIITRFGVLDMRPLHIAAKYVRKWFLFDLMLVALDWSTWVEQDSGHSPLSVLRWVRLARMTRVFRFLSLTSFDQLLRRTATKCRATNGTINLLTNVAASTSCLLLSAHFAACLWHYLGVHLDDGWTTRLGLESSSVSRRYIFSMLWTLNRIQGLATVLTHDASSWEHFSEALLVFSSLVAATMWFSKVNTASMSWALLTNHHHLKRVAHQMVWRLRLSSDMHDRITKFLNATDLGGPQEIAMDEDMLIHKLPIQIQQDLLHEANGPLLRRKQLFAHMSLANPRAERHVCFEALSVSATIEGESVFAVGDACQNMLFIRSGSFTYTLMGNDLQPIREKLAARDKIAENSWWHGHEHPTSSRLWEHLTAAHLTHIDFGRNTVSEIALWTPWTHVGGLAADEDSMLVELSTHEFNKVISNYPDVLSLAFIYGTRFVWMLNHALPDDITDLTSFEFTPEEFETLPTTGSEMDHFLFISHYKVEAGTEATLIHDSLSSTIRKDPRHMGYHLQAPIFIDSEDLLELSHLVSHVEKSHCLLLLLTPGLLSRPWCLLEIVTAVRNDIRIVLVEIQRPGISYQYPNDLFYSELLEGKRVSAEGVELLQREGISLHEVVEALRKVFKKIALPFSPHKSRTVRKAEIDDILTRCN